MAGIVRKVTMCVLTGILSLSQVAAQDRAILYPVQNVDLNGKDTTVASTVFSGDKIKTKKEAADLIQPGTQVQIEPNSSVQYGQSIVMGCGAILVDGPAQVVAGETNISSGRGARYEVSNRNGKVLIQVQAGVAIVKGGSESDLTLEQGQSALRRGASGCTVPGG